MRREPLGVAALLHSKEQSAEPKSCLEKKTTICHLGMILYSLSTSTISLDRMFLYIENKLQISVFREY